MVMGIPIPMHTSSTEWLRAVHIAHFTPITAVCHGTSLSEFKQTLKVVTDCRLMND